MIWTVWISSHLWAIKVVDRVWLSPSVTIGITCIPMDLYLKSFMYRKMPSPLSEKSDSQLQLFLSMTCLLYIFSAVISRYVNASNVYAVPFTVAFWQERGSTTQSEYTIFKQAFLSKNVWDSWLFFCLQNCLSAAPNANIVQNHLK